MCKLEAVGMEVFEDDVKADVAYLMELSGRKSLGVCLHHLGIKTTLQSCISIPPGKWTQVLRVWLDQPDSRGDMNIGIPVWLLVHKSY